MNDSMITRWINVHMAAWWRGGSDATRTYATLLRIYEPGVRAAGA